MSRFRGWNSVRNSSGNSCMILLGMDGLITCVNWARILASKMHACQTQTCYRIIFGFLFCCWFGQKGCLYLIGKGSMNCEITINLYFTNWGKFSPKQDAVSWLEWPHRPWCQGGGCWLIFHLLPQCCICPACGSLFDSSYSTDQAWSMLDTKIQNYMSITSIHFFSSK